MADLSERLLLRLDAPFAVFRPFVAGWYRPTVGFITPSAAYGLLLNVAGIDSRLWEHDRRHDGSAPASLTDDEQVSRWPCRLAVGHRARVLPGDREWRLRGRGGASSGLAFPRVATIYQQLHNYPVGSSGMPPELSKGTKNNITPVRREFLCGIRAILAVDCGADLADRLRRGLRGEGVGRTYGLPFLGDNNFLVDRLEETVPVPTRWFERLDPAERPRPHTSRLTLRVDRGSTLDTCSELLAPTAIATGDPPPTAWVELPQGVIAQHV